MQSNLQSVEKAPFSTFARAFCPENVGNWSCSHHNYYSRTPRLSLFLVAAIIMMSSSPQGVDRQFPRVGQILIFRNVSLVNTLTSTYSEYTGICIYSGVCIICLAHTYIYQYISGICLLHIYTQLPLGAFILCTST